MTKKFCDKCNNEIKNYDDSEIMKYSYFKNLSRKEKIFDLCEKCKNKFSKLIDNFIKDKEC